MYLRDIQRPLSKKLSYDSVIFYVPANMTNHFQPPDLTVNGPAKEFLKEKFETWYASQITEQPDNGRGIYGVEVPLKLSILKPIYTNRIIGFYDYDYDYDYDMKGVWNRQESTKP